MNLIGYLYICMHSALQDKANFVPLSFLFFFYLFRRVRCYCKDDVTCNIIKRMRNKLYEFYQTVIVYGLLPDLMNILKLGCFYPKESFCLKQLKLPSEPT